jgi:hypothetical protein
MAYFSVYARFYDGLQKIGRFFAGVFKFTPARLYLAGIFLLQVLAWWQGIIIKRRLAGEWLVLHYNIDFGVDMLGEPRQIFWFPVFGLLLLVFNFLLTAAFSRREGFRVLAHLFFSASLLFNIFLNLALFAIYLFNFQ